MIDSQLIDAAYEWLCKQRRHFPANADIWYLRYHWHTERARILSALATRTYYFSPMQRITIADGSIVHLWSSSDSLVLKALTLAITPVLPVSRRCTHCRGHGGLKATVRQIHQQQPGYRFVIVELPDAAVDSVEVEVDGTLHQVALKSL